MSGADDEVYKTTVKLVNARLGTALPYLESFDTRQVTVARVILPEIVRVINAIRHPDARHAAYARFHTPLAYPHFADVLEWFETEEYPQSQATLTAIVALVVKARDGQRVWELCRRVPKRPFYYLLLSKLATFKAVEAEVKHAILADLEAGIVPDWELQYIAKVRDPRFDEWFERQASTTTARFQAVGRRRVSKRLPQGITRSPGTPDRRLELMSAEVNLGEAPEFLATAAQQLGIMLPKPLSDLAFLESAPLYRWLATAARSVTGSSVTVWLRLEDVDAVELVFTQDDLQTDPQGKTARPV